VTQTYSTQWHACYPCSQFIDQDDSDALTRRSIGFMSWHPTSLQAQILATIHRTILTTREPRRTLVTTTRWTPAQLRLS
jgi:hypothetical protein